MHELAISEAIARSAIKHAAGRPVASVIVQIGHLRQVVPDALTFSWEMATAGTELDGAELAVDHVPAVVACGACGERTTLEVPVLRCGTCGTHEVALEQGDELVLVSIEIGTPEPAS